MGCSGHIMNWNNFEGQLWISAFMKSHSGLQCPCLFLSEPSRAQDAQPQSASNFREEELKRKAKSNLKKPNHKTNNQTQTNISLVSYLNYFYTFLLFLSTPLSGDLKLWWINYVYTLSLPVLIYSLLIRKGKIFHLGITEFTQHFTSNPKTSVVFLSKVEAG